MIRVGIMLPLLLAGLLLGSFSASIQQLTKGRLVIGPPNVVITPSAWQTDPKMGVCLLVAIKNVSRKKIAALYLSRIIRADQVEMATELGKYQVNLPIGKTALIRIPVAKLGMPARAVAGAAGLQLVRDMTARKELVPISILYADGSFESTE